jgi:hypothetical protein
VADRGRLLSALAVPIGGAPVQPCAELRSIAPQLARQQLPQEAMPAETLVLRVDWHEQFGHPREPGERGCGIPPRQNDVAHRP